MASTAQPEDPDDDDEALDVRLVELGDGGGRLDKALAAALPDLSRSRLQALIAAGAVSRADAPAGDPSAPARPGLYRIAIPPPVSAIPQPEAIPLTVLFEDT